MTCTNCHDTGNVCGRDGDWVGYCRCEHGHAAKAVHTEPAAWRDAHDHATLYHQHPGAEYEVEPLYLASGVRRGDGQQHTSHGSSCTYPHCTGDKPEDGGCCGGADPCKQHHLIACAECDFGVTGT